MQYVQSDFSAHPKSLQASITCSDIPRYWLTLCPGPALDPGLQTTARQARHGIPATAHPAQGHDQTARRSMSGMAQGHAMEDSPWHRCYATPARGRAAGPWRLGGQLDGQQAVLQHNGVVVRQDCSSLQSHGQHPQRMQGTIAACSVNTYRQAAESPVVTKRAHLPNHVA